MNKLEWKEGDIRCLYAEHETGNRFIVAGTNNYELAVAIGSGNKTRTIGYANTLEDAKRFHDKDLSKKLEKKGLGDEFGLG